MGLATAIGIGVAGLGSAIAGSSASKASKRAAQQSQQATDQSIGLQRESRDMALQRLDPFGNRGNAAGNQINALLGLGGGQNMGGPAYVGPNALSGGDPYSSYVQSNPDLMAEFGRVRGQFDDMGDYGQFHYNTYGRNEGRTLPEMQPSAPATAQTAQTAQQAAEQGFDIFKNSTGYQFRVNEGMDALNSGFAGSGLLQSGAALRGLDDYRQGMASAEFGNYLGALGNQQAVGAGAASASAGVGQNFASNAGNLIMNNAGNQANAAIARAQNNPLAQGLGVIGGGLFGYGGLGR